MSTHLYVISAPDRFKQNLFKFGFHSKDKTKLLNRYRTALLNPEIYLFEDGTLEDERGILYTLDEYRQLNDNGNKSEWIKLDLYTLTKVIKGYLASKELHIFYREEVNQLMTLNKISESDRKKVKILEENISVNFLIANNIYDKGRLIKCYLDEDKTAIEIFEKALEPFNDKTKDYMMDKNILLDRVSKFLEIDNDPNCIEIPLYIVMHILMEENDDIKWFYSFYSYLMWGRDRVDIIKGCKINKGYLLNTLRYEEINDAGVLERLDLFIKYLESELNSLIYLDTILSNVFDRCVAFLWAVTDFTKFRTIITESLFKKYKNNFCGKILKGYRINYDKLFILRVQSRK